jgi:hypothetical protein
MRLRSRPRGPVGDAGGSAGLGVGFPLAVNRTGLDLIAAGLRRDDVRVF